MQLCYKVALMDTMKNYFSYTMTTRCGIKQVKLLGTLEDWELLITKVKALYDAKYSEGLRHRLDYTLEVLEKILESYKGNVNTDFWNRMINRDSGSGHDTLDGWIVEGFVFYDAKKKQVFDTIETSDIPYGFSSVPFIWDNQPVGKKFNMTLYAGQTGIEKHIGDLEMISPSFGYVVKQEDEVSK
jgi:hypothetical protein